MYFFPSFVLVLLFFVFYCGCFFLPRNLLQARVSFRRIEAFLSKSGDDVRNEEAYGTAGCDRHCAELAKGEVKIENGTV